MLNERLSAAKKIASELHQAEDDWSNTPRNSPCPCGSGKKYKHCHGALSHQRA